MKINFRQGLVLSEVSTNGQPNYLTFDSNVGITLRTSNRPTTFTAADGVKNYTIEYNTSVLAWPIASLSGVTQAWLYIDLNRTSSGRTYGFTTVAPSYSSTAPINPVNNQCWFDVSKTTMKVYNTTSQSWLSAIRVFAGKYLNGAVTPYSFGTQVGISGVTALTGSIFVDAFGKALKDSQGKFLTTEDTLVVSGTPSHAAKLETNVTLAEAKEPIPAFYVVAYDMEGKVSLANYASVGTKALGIASVNGATGETVNVVLQGQVRNPAWNWTGPNVTLWVSSGGQLVSTDPYLSVGFVGTRQPPVARALNSTTIIFNPGLINMIGDRGPTGSKGDKGEKGDKGDLGNAPNSSVSSKGVAKLSVAPVSATNPIAVGINDPILTAARPPLTHVQPASTVTVVPFGGFTGSNTQQALQHLDSGSTSLNNSIANLTDATDAGKGSGMIGHNDAVNYPAGTVGDKIKKMPTSGGVVSTAQGVVNTHDNSASAHPALSAFITSEATRATTAADIAQQSSGIYDTTAAGILATTTGKYFSVPSVDEAEQLILYKNNAGAALRIKAYPSSTALQVAIDKINITVDAVRGDFPVRVADARQNYTLTYAGGLNAARPAIPTSQLTVATSTGLKLRIGPNAMMLPRSMTPLYRNTRTRDLLTKVVAEFGRYTVDPMIGAVTVGVAWFTNGKAPVAATPFTAFTVISDLADSTRTVEFTFGMSGSDADVIAPLGAVYALPYIQVEATSELLVGILHASDVGPLQDVASTNSTRVADNMLKYTQSFANGTAARRPPLADVTVLVSSSGLSATISAPNSLTVREMLPLNNNTAAYRVNIYTGKYGIAAITGNYEAGIAWYDSSKVRLSGDSASTIVTSIPQFASVSWEQSFVFGGAGSGVMIEAPAGAAYALPFYGLTGSSGALYGSVLDIMELDMNAELQTNYADSPVVLYRDGSSGTMYDFTNPVALNVGLAGQVVTTVDPMIGTNVLKPFATGTGGQGRLNRGRLGLYSHTNDVRMRSATPLLPNGPFTLVFSHVVDVVDRQDTFWQHASAAPGRVQMGANTTFNGVGQIRADGKFQVYIDGITGGAGGGGQPRGATHPIGKPGVISLVVTPGTGLSEFRYNGIVVDNFTAPPVVHQIVTDLFGITAGQGIGQTFGRMLVINRALSSAELEMAEDWAGKAFGLNLTVDKPTPFVEPTLTSDSMTSVYITPQGEGEVIFDKDGSKFLLPASLTKTLTSLIVMDTVLDLEERFTFVAGDATTGSGNNMVAGDSITFYAALCNLMLPSSNVTATALARVVGQKILNAEGGTGDPTTRFITAMNAKCAALGLTASNFTNPHGLYHVNQYTCSRDFVKIGVEATKYDVMLGIWNRKTYDIDVQGPTPRIVNVTASVDMIANGDSDVLGGKTGTLTGYELGGYNLLIYSTAPNGNKLVTVSLRAPSDVDRYADMRATLDALRYGYQWPLLVPTKNV